MAKNEDDLVFPPPLPEVYWDHRTFVYQLTVSQIVTGIKDKPGKKQWCVVQFRNLKPLPQPVNSWNFETKEEAEAFMKKNNMEIEKNQN